MKTYIVIGVAALVLIGGFFVFNNYIYNEKQAKALSPELVQSFATALFEEGTKDGNIPIEGFDADLLLAKFPGLVVEDFEGVEAFEGIYFVENDELVFERTQDRPVSSAERTVSEKGYATLLENVAGRLGMPIGTGEDVKAIVERVSVEGAMESMEVKRELQTKINGGATGSGVTITPIRVLEDSRCPLGVQCIWEGTVRVEVLVDHGFGGVTQIFTLGEPVFTEVGVLTLTSVEPVPIAEVELSEDDYVFVFSIK